MADEREQDEGWGYGTGDETVESPETLSPDERGEEPGDEEPEYRRPKTP